MSRRTASSVPPHTLPSPPRTAAIPNHAEMSHSTASGVPLSLTAPAEHADITFPGLPASLNGDTEGPRAHGRPSEYSQALAALILNRLADGETLRDICAEPEMPNRVTIDYWAGVCSVFSECLARAMRLHADALADESVEAGRAAKDRDSAAAAREKSKALQWIASKRRPDVYGDTMRHVGHDGKAIKHELSAGLEQAILAARKHEQRIDQAGAIDADYAEIPHGAARDLSHNDTDDGA